MSRFLALAAYRLAAPVVALLVIHLWLGLNVPNVIAIFVVNLVVLSWRDAQDHERLHQAALAVRDSFRGLR